jgi:Bifunctional DNA primase/polymerase, N-terminal
MRMRSRQLAKRRPTFLAGRRSLYRGSVEEPGGESTKRRGAASAPTSSNRVSVNRRQHASMYSSFAANFQVNDAQSDALALAIESALDAGAPPLEIALTYCRHGIPVFPLSAETKRPYEKGSHHLATIDEPVIRTWWLRWPGAAVGIAAGPPSRVWLLDLDERPGGSQPRLGITALRNLGFEPSRVAKCIVETPSGGLHLAFRLPPGTHIPNRAGDIAPGVDVRGTTRLKKGSASENNADRYTARGYEDRPDIVSGGYCVAAGSRRADGRHYAFKKGSYLSAGPAPLRLLRLGSL